MKLSEVEVLRMVSVVFDAASVITCTWLLSEANRASMEVALNTDKETGSVTIIGSHLNKFLVSVEMRSVEMLFSWASLLLEVHISVRCIALFCLSRRS